MPILADFSPEGEPCFFCYKTVDKDENGNQDNKATSLQRFFSVLEKLFGSRKWSSTLRDALFQFQGRTSSCGDCCKLLESFCGIHHEIKVLELHLHWKLETVKNVMKLADRVPTRVKLFREIIMEKLDREGKRDGSGEDGNSNKSFLELMETRRTIIRHWSRYLSQFYPKVITDRCDAKSKGRDSSTNTETTQNTLPDQMNPNEVKECIFDYVRPYFYGWAVSFLTVVLLYLEGNATNTAFFSMAANRNSTFATTLLANEELSISTDCQTRSEENLGNENIGDVRDSDDDNDDASSISLKFEKSEVNDGCDKVWSDASDLTPMETDSNGASSTLSKVSQESSYEPRDLHKEFDKDASNDDTLKPATPPMGFTNLDDIKVEPSEHGQDKQQSNSDQPSSTVTETFKMQCPDCPKKFPTKVALQNHGITHLFRRDLLNKKIPPDGITLEELILKTHAKFCCDVETCKSKFHTLEELDNHSKLHGRFPCSICNHVEIFAPDLAIHESNHYEEKFDVNNITTKTTRFHCVRCPHKTASLRRDTYMDHFLVHHLGLHSDDSDKLRCSICQLSFSESKSIIFRFLKHYKTQHGWPESTIDEEGLKSFLKCDNCSAYFRNLIQLDRHWARVHAIEAKGQRHRCQDCGKCLATRPLLLLHRTLLHNAQTDFVCTIKDCGRKFETLLNLEFHKTWLHRNNTQVFVCSICKRKFMRKSVFKKHLAFHKKSDNGRRKTRHFSCHQCSAAFKWKRSLELHKATHVRKDTSKNNSMDTAVKQLPSSSVPNMEIALDKEQEDVSLPMRQLRTIHKCAICERTFSNLKGLQSHQDSLHNGHDEKRDIDSDSSNSSSDSPRVKVEKTMADVDNEWKNGFESDSDVPISSNMSASSENEGSNLAVDKSPKQNGTSRKKPTTSSSVGKRVTRRRRTKLPRKPRKNPLPQAPPLYLETFNLQCPNCPKKFPSNSLLHQHINNTHVPQRYRLKTKISPDGMTIKELISKTHAKFQCNITDCSKRFHTQNELDKHSELHGSFECSVCDHVEIFAPDLALHELSHSKGDDETERSFKCARCARKYSVRVYYTDHFLETHLGMLNDKIRCPICQAPFTNQKRGSHVERYVFSHYKTHHELPPATASRDDDEVPKTVHKCDICPAYFLHLFQLDKHKGRIHGGPTKLVRFSCADCERTFDLQHQLRDHRSRAHNVERRFRCTFKDCWRAFETATDLELHKATHARKVPLLICYICGRKCLGKGSLTTHLRVHDDGRQQRIRENRRMHCDQCGKVCKNKNTLEVHILSHSGPESWQFTCEVCAKKCMTQQKLEEHLRTHSKEKPFVCDTCGQAYKHRHNLRIHVNNKHGRRDIPHSSGIFETGRNGPVNVEAEK